MDFEKFEELDPEKQAEIFQQSNFKDKGELLLRAAQPAALVRKLSQEEFYLISKEMDVQERSEIVRYANLAQLHFISDLECWDKDRINPQNFVTWLETLREAEGRQLADWLIRGDYAMVVAGFSKVIQVLKTEREYAMDELMGDKPYFTLDENYFITVTNENYDTIKRAFETLFETHRGRYVSILEGVLSEVEDQMEDEAYEGRERRLSERGFPDPESAFIIYRPMSEAEFESFPLKAAVTAPVNLEGEDWRANPPNYLAAFAKDRLFLDDVLLSLSRDDHKIYDSVREEMAWLSNKTIACSGIDFSSEERVAQGVERARHFVNLGLEIISGKDLVRAEALLKERWLEIIFRRASTELHHLRNRALAVVRQHWNGDREMFVNFLSEPFDFMLRGILRTVPEYYEPTGKADLLFRDFITREDLDRMRKAVESMEVLHAALNQKIPNMSSLFSERVSQSDADYHLFTALNQMLAHHCLEHKFSIEKLNRKQFTHFTELAFTGARHHRVMKSEVKDRFLSDWLTEKEKILLTPVWSLAFDALTSEISDIEISDKSDLRFIHSLDLAVHAAGK